MASKNRDGKFIISAGEVGMYTVCPESWRLQMVEKVSTTTNKNSAEGEELHLEWARKFEEAVYLSRSAKLLIPLILLTAIFYALLRSFS